ncbi:MAG TPA: hypothetical protein PKM57_02265 [Kiritimatiellia bacterium]|nr:hypothetical protein [Kiritimatiellia bacterium]HPS08568.1 hypothetical protein [Kiritimatiellia bacterium]
MNKRVFFIDDDAMERRSCVDVLCELFKDTNIEIEALAPFATLGEYSDLIASKLAAALILDEKLNTTGLATYTGAELAAHLRAIGGSLPIVILTNYPPSDFPSQGWAVENIFAKKNVLTDPKSPEAQAFKLRLSRQIITSGKLLADHEQRYHDLLVKSTKNDLNSAESAELIELEADRIAPVAAAERERFFQLDTEIHKLKQLLGGEGLL